MANTTSLSIELMEIGSQAKETIFNDAVQEIIDGTCGYLSKSVAGGVDVTLTAAEARNAVLETTGLLTANINVIVPTEEKTYIVFNNTTGAFTLTVKTSGGSGAAVTQGTKALLYCNGTNVVAGPGGTGSGVTDGDKGDITVSSSGTVWTIDAGVVTYAKMQDVSATNRLLGRSTAGSGDVEEITVAGDLSQSGSTFTIANDAVTYAKMQNVSATSRVLGRKTGGAGDAEECTLSEVLDFVGSAAQGDILYRGAATWTRLGAGTNGHFLQTQGAGADPQWASATGISGLTANKVVYATGATSIATDTDLHWDSTNNILGIVATTAGTSGVAVLSMGNGTVPTTGITDGVQLYSIDGSAGQAGLGITNESAIHHVLSRQWLLGSRSLSGSMTQGLVVDQAGNNDGILQFRHTGGSLAHGMTSILATDISTDWRLVSGTAGGAQYRALTESTIAHIISGLHTTETTTKSTNADAPVIIEVGTKSGTSVAGLGANANMFAVQDRFAANPTKFIVDQGGNIWIPGALTGIKSVEANTAGSGSPNILDGATESFKVLTNEGSTARNYHTLPTAVAGYEFTFISQDADLMRITAAAGDTIRVSGGVTATGGFIENGAQGDFIRLVAINATEWIDVGSRGTWTPT